MPLVVRNENIDRLMSLKFARENERKMFKTHLMFRKVVRKNGMTYYDLCQYANEPAELISETYYLRLLKTHRNCLLVDKVYFGGYRNGDYYLLILMKNGIVEFLENGKFMKCFERSEK